ncbi:Uncharacterised protein [Klebsiella pneumoniae]|nr:Uncharacterised protein [Klebsiella pneumoniae]
MGDKLGQQFAGRLNKAGFEKLIRLMRLFNRPGAEHQGRAQILNKRCFGAVIHRLRFFAEQVFNHTDHFMIRRAGVTRDRRMQFLNRQPSRPALFHRLQRGIEHVINIAEGHARQRADIHMQFTAAADTVCRITTMNMTEIHGRIRDNKRRVIEFFFQLVTQRHQVRDGFIHQLNRIDTALRVTGMTGLTGNADSIGEVAFVCPHRL